MSDDNFELPILKIHKDMNDQNFLEIYMKQKHLKRKYINYNGTVYRIELDKDVLDLRKELNKDKIKLQRQIAYRKNKDLNILKSTCSFLSNKILKIETKKNLSIIVPDSDQSDYFRSSDEETDEEIPN